MGFSKNRIKKIFKNKVQTKKIFKKERKDRKERKRVKKNTFRNNKINIRNKSIKQYRKRIAKKKRKNYIQYGGNSNSYSVEISKKLNTFMKKGNREPSKVDDPELKYYNFDFILPNEPAHQKILKSSDIEEEFNKKAKTDREIEEKEREEKEREEKEDKNYIKKDIEKATRKSIEESGKTCEPQVFLWNGKGPPVVFTDSCGDNNEPGMWMQHIFNSV